MERTFSRRGNTQPKLTKTITMMTRSMTRRIAELEKENEKLKEVNEALQQEDDERFLNRCDWCATIISDDDFWLCNCCCNSKCDKMVCGREGCSSKLAFYVCCEECDESAYQDSEDESDDDEEQD
jgi:hypothetical protein